MVPSFAPFVADSVEEHKSALALAVDVLGCQRLNKDDSQAEQVRAIAQVLLEVELLPTPPSNSNILHQSWLGCCSPQRHPFLVAWIYNLLQCVQLHLKELDLIRKTSALKELLTYRKQSKRCCSLRSAYRGRANSCDRCCRSLCNEHCQFPSKFR